MYTYSVKANEAGNEAATEEVLYSGLTKAVALSTARGCADMAAPDEQGKYNYFIAKEAEVKTYRVEDAEGRIVFSSDNLPEASLEQYKLNEANVGVGYEPNFQLLTGEGDEVYILTPRGY